ncbi:trichohyalin-like [Lucilia sericata]|uniref:trichohyalin-like n=1 Tax=Lucilia sericata TaxID=13632 RepID=UPI0018A821ED|nr:trichohyalin-like [Lucilia sericata]
MEDNNYEQENLKEQQQMRRKLEQETKLYGKWCDGVNDDNLVFESKNGHQLQHGKEEETAKERQHNKTEELQEERQLTRENEIREMRNMQEYHMNQLREQRKDIDDLKEKEKQLKANLNELENELKLLEESYSILCKPIDVGNASNLYKVRILMRNRSEVFRNQIKLCLSILERSTKFAENSRMINNLKDELNQQLNVENHKFSQLENMHESDIKHHLQHSEEIWQQENKERYHKLKKFIMDEHLSIKTSLNEIMKTHEEFLEIRAKHLGNMENSSEQLKFLKPEEHAQFSPRHQSANNIIHSQVEESGDSSLYAPRRSGSVNSLELDDPHNQFDSSKRHNCQETYDNNMSPRPNDVNQVSGSVTNLNLDVSENQQTHLSHLEIECEKAYAQRSLQVVTSETEADRPRFGRKHMAFD